MYDQLQSTRTTHSFDDQHWTAASPAASLATITSETDRLVGRLSMQLATLAEQTCAIEESLHACEAHAIYLDAWVDDALFRGDADTARICSARAALLRSELARIADAVQTVGRGSRNGRDELRSLSVRLRE